VRLIAAILLGLAACAGSENADDLDPLQQGLAGRRPVPFDRIVRVYPDGRDLASIVFAKPVVHRSPIADFIKTATRTLGAAEFKRGIHDLAVFEDRLYFGYGDADRNLGRVMPIEIRALAGYPPNVITEAATAEEEVATFRVLPGGRLMIPGLDPVRDSFIGNMYNGTGGTWRQHHALPDAVHVHDVTEHDGMIYAVGSGARSGEWPNFVHAYLWRSNDGGNTYDVIARIPNEGRGDCRAYRLATAGNDLYVFGYKTGANNRADRIASFWWSGEQLKAFPPDHPLVDVLALDTAAFGDVGVVRGIVSIATRKVGAWTIDAIGETRFIAPVRGRTAIDFIAGDQDFLILTIDGDDFDARPLISEVRVFVTRDFSTYTELLSYQTRDRPRSIAYWRGQIWIGTDGGKLLASSPWE